MLATGPAYLHTELTSHIHDNRGTIARTSSVDFAGPHISYGTSRALQTLIEGPHVCRWPEAFRETDEDTYLLSSFYLTTLRGWPKRLLFSRPLIVWLKVGC